MLVSARRPRKIGAGAGEPSHDRISRNSMRLHWESAHDRRHWDGKNGPAHAGMPRVARVRRSPSVRRAFLDWLSGTGAGYAGRIGIRRWTGRMLMFHFDRGHPFLQGVLRPNGLTVWAQVNGEYWDAVLARLWPFGVGVGWRSGSAVEAGVSPPRDPPCPAYHPASPR